MELRYLGKTGLRITRVGFGGIPIQTVPEEQAVEVVKRCHELGINYYDTARAYTVSEERVGKALEGVRDDVILATKSISRTKEGVLQDLEMSLRKLRTSYIDVYQLHNVTYPHQWEEITAPGGALEGAHKALDEGKILHLGITGHNASLLARIVETGTFETAMIPYNLLTLEPEAELLPLCRKMGVGTVAMKPFGGGSFSSFTAALKFVLGKEDVDVAIPGMNRLFEVEENVAIATGQYDLTAEELSMIEHDKEALGDTFCRNCDYCQPCPQGIPISFALRAESQFLRRAGWSERLGVRMSEAVDKLETCIDCGSCEARCPYDLPVRDLLQERSASMTRLLDSVHSRGG